MKTFSYLTKDNVFKRYAAAKTYTDELTLPFPEYQRIARNKPYARADTSYPSVTDGTTASIIRKTPRRIIQQLPSGSVITDDNGWLGMVADFILNHKILPSANEEYDLIQKCWTVVEASLTYGACATYTPFVNHDGNMSPDMSTIYWGDMMLQPGKKSGYANSYQFFRSWWQTEDIEALIDREKKLKSSAEKRGDEYDSSWDLESLEQVKLEQTAKDKQAMTPEERERGTSSTPVQFVTGVQKGIGAKFYTFTPDSKVIVRTETNKDPRGKYPIDWMYGDIDGTNPLGRGIVDLVGGLQNLIDSDMQMYQYNRALALDPPVIIKGINKNKVKYAPAAILDAGNNYQADVIPLKIDTSAIINYPQLYGLQKSQLLNLVNSPDTSISSDVGNPNFSKTSQGVQAQQAVISVDDNYVRKMFEAWFEHWAETAINLYFAKRSGIEELQLDKDTAMKLRELTGFDKSLLSEDNKIRIDYDTDTPALKFRVNPSTTTVKDQAAQVQDATNLLELVEKFPMLDKRFGGAIDPDVLARRIVINSGIDNPEEVAPEPTQAEIQAKEQAKDKINPFSPMFDKPSIHIDYGDVEDPQSRAALLGLAGAPPANPLSPISPKLAENAARNLAQVLPEEQTQPQVDPNAPPPIDPNAQIPPPVDPNKTVVTPDHMLKAQAQAHQQAQDNAKLALEIHKTNNPAQTTKEGVTKPPKPFLPPPQQAQQTQQPLTPQLEAEDHKIIAQLTQLGFSSDIINQVIEAVNSGVPAQQVIAQLTGVNHG